MRMTQGRAERRGEKMACATWSLIALMLLMAWAGQALAADPPEVPEKEAIALLDEREEKLTQLATLDGEIAGLTQELERLPTKEEFESYIEDHKRAKQHNDEELKRANAAARPDPERIRLLQEELRRGADYLSRLQRDSARLAPLEAELAAKNAVRAALATDIRKTERAISSAFSFEKARQRFRETTSLYFCILLAVIILGFFVAIVFKTKSPTSIFDGEKGIQMLALFLIVIAIILFGILGVLEGKELSALLGGLSGYILGRVTSPQSPGGRDVVTGQRAAAGADAPSQSQTSIDPQSRAAAATSAAHGREAPQVDSV